ncbi:MAG: heme ABC transporter ATP-binding protein [Pseudomonadota bacterium]
MYEVKDVSLSYGDKNIMRPTNLTLRNGELTVIIGPNGAGKSSLLKLVTGQVKPSTGSIEMDGDAISRIRPAEFANRRAVLSQSNRLSFPFTVLEVVRLGMLNRFSDRDCAHDMLHKVDLPGFEGRFFQDLSGGEQQRVHFARVLCQLETASAPRERQFLFLDEPTSSLDIKHQLSLLDVARSYCQEGVGVVAVLHDVNMTALYADRVIVMSEGAVVGDGTPRETITDQCMRDTFGVALEVGRVPGGDTPFVLPAHGAV